jgi:hypothetical protein
MIGSAISTAGNEFLISQSSTVSSSTEARITAPTSTIITPRRSDIAVVPFSSISARYINTEIVRDVDHARQIEPVERVRQLTRQAHLRLPSQDQR